MDVVEATELIVVLVVIGTVLPLVWLIGRRRWLSELGGTFECGLRTQGSSGFMQGVARYNGEYFEWFRAFSLSLSPRYRFRQNRWEIEVTRAPRPGEVDHIFGMDSIVDMKPREDDAPVELAMPAQSVIGLRSWLESAPAGRGRYGNTAH